MKRLTTVQMTSFVINYSDNGDFVSVTRTAPNDGGYRDDMTRFYDEMWFYATASASAPAPAGAVAVAVALSSSSSSSSCAVVVGIIAVRDRIERCVCDEC